MDARVSCGAVGALVVSVSFGCSGGSPSASSPTMPGPASTSSSALEGVRISGLQQEEAAPRAQGSRPEKNAEPQVRQDPKLDDDESAHDGSAKPAPGVTTPPMTSPAPTPESASTTGEASPISENDLGRLLAPHLEHLRRCVNTEATVSLRLSVASGGQILSASATRSAPDDARLRDCVVTVFKELAFARPASGSTTLAFDLSLSPLDRR